MKLTRIAGALFALATMTSPAGAVMLAKLRSAGQPLLLCPKPSCPSVAAPQSEGMIAILEISGGFARLSSYMTAEEAAARYPGIDASGLPERVALWIDRRHVTTGDPAADEAADLAARQADEPKTIARPEIPARPPVPQRAPRTSVAEAGAAAAGSQATLPENPAGNGLPPPDAAARIAASPPALTPAPLAREVAAAEPGPQGETTQAPAQARLTAELMDKRLKVLPQKPDADFSLAQIVAIRRTALSYLESGECTGIKDGGKTLTPGFLYIICDGDEAWRQFAE